MASNAVNADPPYWQQNNQQYYQHLPPEQHPYSTYSIYSNQTQTQRQSQQSQSQPHPQRLPPSHSQQSYPGVQWSQYPPPVIVNGTHTQQMHYQGQFTDGFGVASTSKIPPGVGESQVTAQDGEDAHNEAMNAAYSSVSQIEATPYYNEETGEATYPCPFCNKEYGGKHARSIWRRHLSNKHDIPLNLQPRRTRWDNDTNRPKDEAERHKRTLESKRRWAAKNRAEKRAKSKGPRGQSGEGQDPFDYDTSRDYSVGPHDDSFEDSDHSLMQSQHMSGMPVHENGSHPHMFHAAHPGKFHNENLPIAVAGGIPPYIQFHDNAMPQNASMLQTSYSTASSPNPSSQPMELNFIPYERVPQNRPNNIPQSQMQGTYISAHMRNLHQQRPPSAQPPKRQVLTPAPPSLSPNWMATPSLQRSVSAPEGGLHVNQSFLQPVPPASTVAGQLAPAPFFLAPPPPLPRSVSSSAISPDPVKTSRESRAAISPAMVSNALPEAPAMTKAPSVPLVSTNLTKSVADNKAATSRKEESEAKAVSQVKALNRADSKAEAAMQLLALKTSSSSPPVSPTGAGYIEPINDSGFADAISDDDEEIGVERKGRLTRKQIQEKRIAQINPADRLSLSPESSPLQLGTGTAGLPPAGTPTKKRDSTGRQLDSNDENAGYMRSLGQERISLDSSPDGPPLQKRRLLPSSPTTSSQPNRGRSLSNSQPHPSSSAATYSSVQTPHTNFHHYKLNSSLRKKHTQQGGMKGLVSNGINSNNIFHIDNMSRPSAGLGVLSSPANFLLSSPEHAAVSKSLGLVPENYHQPSAFNLNFLDGYEGGISSYAAGVFGPKSDE